MEVSPISFSYIPPQFMAGEEQVTSAQRWALKVSIHCEGCKRKVQKIISNTRGVERVDIDLKQHKVCVQGNVDPQTVIWKLEKAGKHAELWPQEEKPVSKESKKLNKVKDKSKDKQKNSLDKVDSDQSRLENRKVESPAPGGEAKHEAEDGKGRKAEDARNKGPEMAHNPAIVETGAGAAEKEATTAPEGSQSPTDVNGGKTVEGNGENKKKKKKSKGQDRKKETCETDEVHSLEKDAAAGTTLPGCSNSNNGPVNQGPPRQPRVLHPEHNYQSRGPVHEPPPDEFPASNGGYYNYSPPPPQRHQGPPVYAVNYHTAHPCGVYGTSQYYAPHPPMNTYHEYLHPRQEEPRPYYDPYYQRPPESFQLFSDENPNACSLM
ncbi:hypothetical protein MLD38_035892 [Melastoma candidum]|uniref:Uncharacterized protein n=1 Tax=Melastoma candidum TaxID=119954 RepID=A0ACB9LHY3_9MYRT|nr:hypothetical protein MLD38_035892 [Melastoma candidum]